MNNDLRGYDFEREISHLGILGYLRSYQDCNYGNNY